MTTDEAIQLGRLAAKLANLAEPERRTLLDMIRKAPKTILDLLEEHPRVLYTTAGVASFIAVKDQLLGNVQIVTDENGVIQSIKKPGFFERIWSKTADKFSAPLAAIIWIAGLILLGWGGVKLWGTFRVEKTKVRIKEAQLAREAKKAREQANHSPQA
jgi:hypothetical protein